MLKISTFRLKLQPSRQSDMNFYTEHNGYKEKMTYFLVLHPVFDELPFSNCTNKACFVSFENTIYMIRKRNANPKCNFRNVESRL